MAKKIYVGNLSYNTDEERLKEVFSEFGAVESVKVIVDRDTGRHRGFGFVEMVEEAHAKAAIDGLNDKEVDGRQLKVNEAKEREERTPGGGGGKRYNKERFDDRY